jgi:hypothetical protein
LDHIPRAVLEHQPTDIAPDLLIPFAIKYRTTRFGNKRNVLRVLFAENTQHISDALRGRGAAPRSAWPNIEPNVRIGGEDVRGLGIHLIQPVLDSVVCCSNNHVCDSVSWQVQGLQCQQWSWENVTSPALTFLAVDIDHLHPNSRLELESIIRRNHYPI